MTDKLAELKERFNEVSQRLENLDIFLSPEYEIEAVEKEYKEVVAQLKEAMNG
jgi:hypothetical protein